jgi:hypothetical protein
VKKSDVFGGGFYEDQKCSIERGVCHFRLVSLYEREKAFCAADVIK